MYLDRRYVTLWVFERAGISDYIGWVAVRVELAVGNLDLVVLLKRVFHAAPQVRRYCLDSCFPAVVDKRRIAVVFAG